MSLQNNNSVNWISGKARDLYKWATKNASFTKSPDSPKVTTSETNEEKKIREAKEEIIKKLEEFKSQTSLGKSEEELNGSLNAFLNYEEQKIQFEGIVDGQLGTKNNTIAHIAAGRASYIFDQTKTTIAGRFKGIENEISILKDIIVDHKSEYTLEKTFYDKLQDAKRYSPRHFSLFLAFFYLIIGVAMMIADFPISVGIAENFISLDHLAANGKFLERIKNWDIILFAAGITFLSIYFKIFYDKYINTGVIKRETKEPKKDAKEISIFVFNIFILLALIFTLYYLSNIRNALNKSVITPPSNLTANGFITIHDVYLFRLKSFIGTTILLPLISGICFSLSLGIWSNWNNLRKTKNKCENSIKKLEKYNEDLRSLERRKALLDSINNEWAQKAEERKKGIIEQLTSSYNQGYKRGHKLTFKDDIYENAHLLYIEQLLNN
jgi:hypothetical protein